MRVLITGGTGFIGSHLAQRCVKEGWHTTVVDRERNQIDDWSTPLFETGRFGFVCMDMINPLILNSIRKGDFDVIFHQAAVPRVSYSVEHPAETTDENILKMVQVLEAAKGNCRRFIFASSSSVYGGADQLPTPESYSLNPKSPYALQKKVGEEFCRLFGELYDMDTVCLRYFNVFGPRQLGDSPYSTAISAWCHSIKQNVPLRKDGTGDQSRDMCYVDNVVDANVKAAVCPHPLKGAAFNIACGDQVSNNEILSALQKKHPTLQVNQAPFRAGDVMHTKADISFADQMLGYRPLVRFWEGFRRTLEWWNI